MDLKFPHHENEIAQSCAACDAPFVHIWMHNGFVRIDDEKMSKSMGNFFTVRDVLKSLRDPEVLRLFLLSSHYRGPINYSQVQLAQADETLLGFYRALNDVAGRAGDVAGRADDVAGRADEVAGSAGAAHQKAWAEFHAAMEDDFNTPGALAVMQSVARELNSAKAAGSQEAAPLAATLGAMGQVLGVLQQEPGVFLKRAVGPVALSDSEVERLLLARREARATKNFKESDRIRDVLSGAGILLEDKPGGITGWRRA